MSLHFKVVIPARYNSTRLPGKPLRLIHDKPMIEWVYQAALKSQAGQVVVATDDQRIEQQVLAFGGEVCMTRTDHATGTDRIVEVVESLGWKDDTVIVNLQGDEPLMPAANILQVATNLLNSGCDMATLHKTINREQAQNPNQVKLVCDQLGRALYFSRSLLPYDRDGNCEIFLGHIGIYAYTAGFIKTYTQLQPCDLERCEQLEQLRALYHDYRIHTEHALEKPGPGVDTRADLETVITLLADQQ